MELVVDSEKCDGCGKCIEICPIDSIILENNKAYITVDCVECCMCVPQCPLDAILLNPDGLDGNAGPWNNAVISKFKGGSKMRIREALEKYRKSPGSLIRAMLEYQRSTPCNYLTEADIEAFAEETNLPISRVYSLAAFYSLFSTKPRGKYIIQVCYDIPCYVNNSINVVKELEKSLKIKMGQTTYDGLFTIEYSSCLGCCDKAPAMQIGDTLYGNLTPDRIVSILETYRRIKDE